MKINKTHIVAAIDLLAVLLPDDVYVKLVEKLREKVRIMQQVLRWVVLQEWQMDHSIQLSILLTRNEEFAD